MLSPVALAVVIVMAGGEMLPLAAATLILHR
jgi:hypothetical protein